MSRFVESIAVKNGRFRNLRFHQQRMSRTLREVYGTKIPYDLMKILRKEDIQKDRKLIKCRFVYDESGYHVEHKAYKGFKISNLKIVVSDSNLDYPYKSVDRTELDQLYNKRGPAQEILILKKGLLTDAYYFNVVLSIGGELITPRSPLLNGVMRQFYLKKGRIKTYDISLQMIKECEYIHLINALNPLGKISLSPNQIINMEKQP